MYLMKETKVFAAFSVILWMVACQSKPVSVFEPSINIETQPPPQIQMGDENPSGQLDPGEAATFESLQLVDAYPLYSMHYYAEYDLFTENTSDLAPLIETGNPWACSLFAASGDINNSFYGRNFDWEFSPALILFTDPPDKYASVSMVNLDFLGFEGELSRNLVEQPIEEKRQLLDAPMLPLDGMNEMGLVVGMAAVPSSSGQPDPTRMTIGSLGIIRYLLDNAADVSETIEIFSRFNIDFSGGPNIHYLISDRNGDAVIIEIINGEQHIIHRDNPWQSMTNFYISSIQGPLEGHCSRYDTIEKTLRPVDGAITSTEALSLLEDVSQEGTQWSIVYGFSSGHISISMGENYDEVYEFSLQLTED